MEKVDVKIMKNKLFYFQVTFTDIVSSFYFAAVRLWCLFSRFCDGSELFQRDLGWENAVVLCQYDSLGFDDYSGRRFCIHRRR